MTGTIEKVYAQALFEFGLEENNLNGIAGELAALSLIFDAEPELIKLLSSPTIPLSEKSSLLERLFKTRVSEGVYSFLCILTEKKRIRYFSSIAMVFKEKYNAHDGIVEIIAITASPINPALREKLLVRLELLTGRKVELVEKVDASILGGIVLNYGNTEINSSIKFRLDTLYAQMKAIIA